MREREPAVSGTLMVLPGNALAATSENAAVSATEPATNQRLMRFSLRRAASLMLVGLDDIGTVCGPLLSVR